MLIFDIAMKTLRESLRQPKALAVGLGIPLAFMLIFGLAFGGSEQVETVDVIVQDEDEGELGARFADGLRDLRHDDGRSVFRVTDASADEEAESRRAIEDRDAAMLVVIPRNFSAGLVPAGAPPPGGMPPLVGGGQRPPVTGTTLTLVGDPSAPQFTVASQALALYAQRFGEAVTGEPAPVRTATEAVTSAELTTFDFIAPGLMVFAILSLLPRGAVTLTREVELHTLDRVRLSPARTWELLGGVSLALVLLMGVSVGLMLVVARLMGFHNQGSYAVAYLIALGSALSVVGLGMIIASFTTRQEEAIGIATLVSVPASFLSGAFFPVPSVDLFTLRGVTVDLYDALPTTHAIDAMRAVMTFGADVDRVVGSLLAMGALTVVYFVVGAALYRARRLAAE